MLSLTSREKEVKLNGVSKIETFTAIWAKTRLRAMSNVKPRHDMSFI